jgi:hypothetical protein
MLELSGPIPEMTPDEFMLAVDLLFDGDVSAVSRYLDHAADSKVATRWASGTVPVSKAVTILLRAMIHFGSSPAVIRQKAMQPIEPPPDAPDPRDDFP